MFWVKNGLVHPLTRTARIRAQTSPVKHNSHLFMELNATQHSYNFPTPHVQIKKFVIVIMTSIFNI